MGGKLLEAGKFAVYLGVPAAVVAYYYFPENLNGLVNKVIN